MFSKRTLSEGYSEQDLLDKIAGRYKPKTLVAAVPQKEPPPHAKHQPVFIPSDDIRGKTPPQKASSPSPKELVSLPVPMPTKPNMLIDIEAKILQGYSPGFEHYAKVYNLKEAAQTLIFLQENGISNMEQMRAKTQKSKDDFNAIAQRIHDIEARLPEITALQRAIGTYSKTREVFKQFRESGWDKKFKAKHAEEIQRHKEAKAYFDEHNISKKLPTIKALQTEYATLEAEKKKLWGSHKTAREKMQTMLTAQGNVERLLKAPPAQSQQKKRQEESL